MFRITAASRRLAVLRSHRAVGFQFFHQTAIRTNNEPSQTTADPVAHDTETKKEDSLTEHKSAEVSKTSSAQRERPKSRTKTVRKSENDATTTSPKRKGVAKRKKKENLEVPDGQVLLTSPLKKDMVLNGNIRDPKNVHETLKWAYSEASPGKKTLGDTKRMNIISESLCDDILERLKPSLEEYKGCDILDINPGAGVWSSKLHNYLKPRSHVLMEPDHAVYQRLLQPLLDKPDSTYTLVPQSGIIWGQLEKVLTEKYFPHQEKLPSGDPRLSQSNKTLLVVANLAFEPKKPYKGFASLSQLVIYQFLSALKANSLFHQYGLARMVVWINDDEKSYLIPRNVVYRRKAAVEIEIACPRATEVASSTNKPMARKRRDPLLDFKGLPQVLKRMEEKGIKTPPGRDSILMTELAERKFDSVDDYKTRPHERAQMEELVQGLSIDEDGMVWGADEDKVKKYRLHASHLKFRQKKRGEMRRLVEDNQTIVELEKEMYNTPDANKAKSLKEDLARRTEAWNDAVVEICTNKERQVFWPLLDNSRAFDDQLLMWDRRDFEPLRARADEFYPPKEMALLDLQPASQWPVLRDKYPHNDEILEFILTQLNMSTVQSVKKGLTSLWPGAYDWMIEHCPSLTDPNKGGVLDLDTMPVRRLSVAMYKEILEAWLEWPWRPTRWDVIHKLGSEHFDPDAAADD